MMTTVKMMYLRLSKAKFLSTMLYTIAGFVMHCRTVPWSFFIEMLFQWCILFV